MSTFSSSYFQSIFFLLLLEMLSSISYKGECILTKHSLRKVDEELKVVRKWFFLSFPKHCRIPSAKNHSSKSCGRTLFLVEWSLIMTQPVIVCCTSHPRLTRYIWIYAADDYNPFWRVGNNKNNVADCTLARYQSGIRGTLPRAFEMSIEQLNLISNLTNFAQQMFSFFHKS